MLDRRYWQLEVQGEQKFADSQEIFQGQTVR
jgi:hypothetical protein